MIENKTLSHHVRRSSPAIQDGKTVHALGFLRMAVLLTFTAGTSYGQTTDPWTTAIQHLVTAINGPISRGAALIAVIIGGIEIALGEGNSRRTIIGLLVGLGLILGASQILAWLYI